MPPTDLLLAFLISTALFAFIPGPAMLYAAARTLAGGRRAGLMAAFGVHVGGYAHVLAAATGLSVLFHAVPALYTAVKLAGAVYLVVMGWRLATGHAAESTESRELQEPRRAFAQSVLVELLNPKTAIFFLAFLPQFVHPESGSSLVQFAVLGLIFSGLSAVYTSLLALAIRPLSRGFKGLSKLRRWEGKIIGTLFMGLGLKVALQQR